jgi:hypothetical protein
VPATLIHLIRISQKSEEKKPKEFSRKREIFARQKSHQKLLQQQRELLQQQPSNRATSMNKILVEFQQQNQPKFGKFQKHHVPPKIHREIIQFSSNSHQL